MEGGIDPGIYPECAWYTWSSAACRGVSRKPDGAVADTPSARRRERVTEPLERFSPRQDLSSHEQNKRFQMLETVAVMEDLRSERPSGLDAYHVAGCPRNQFVKVWDLYVVIGSGSVDPSVSFHAVPRDEPRRSRWLNAVPMIGRQKELKKPVALGVPQKGLLTRSAVPSLLAPSFPPQVPSQEQTSVS
ncbi:hypothetical protein HPB52_021275 [Rhipicephalus sanguineus]|uniref:Uncharacterized protein n=1 Tax=Rhipicephalus sanguineus TaxID=34632 RepID=A0A9D4T1S9_RHISA|nr:hypothetical protein HPB52_021275 [Rhipicephalus sanguineus]